MKCQIERNFATEEGAVWRNNSKLQSHHTTLLLPLSPSVPEAHCIMNEFVSDIKHILCHHIIPRARHKGNVLFT